MVLYDVIVRGKTEYPDRTAILYRDTALTYGQLHDAVNRFGNALMGAGIKRGDRVGILLPNLPPFTITYYGATSIGAVAVPANPLLKAPELVHIWGDADVKLVVTIPQLLNGAMEAAAKVGVERVLCVGPRDAVPAEVATFDEFLATGQRDRRTGPRLHRPMPTIPRCSSTHPARRASRRARCFRTRTC
ncbi:MAG: AMP-binding protein [Armatimonadetes bacterium]|nr:AMP-binding protein [Armatimonadota bacterium]